MGNKDKSNVHRGHRSRVRTKFIRDGNLDNFQPHEVLELLLFYAYPMKDTNEIAHRLLKEYGSLYNLFNAKPQDLMNNLGLSENVAVYLSMLPSIFKMYLRTGLDDTKPLTNSNIAGKYMESYLKGNPTESFYMISLNIKKNVLAVDRIAEGGVSNVKFEIRKIIERALLNKARFVIIGHNHPGGILKPSEDDAYITQRLMCDLKLINVDVLDHIIVTNKGTYSFCANKICGLTYNPDTTNR